jgi:hypothetical protein
MKNWKANILGIFNGCISNSDVKEFEIDEPKGHVKEKRNYSSKKKIKVTKRYQ